MQCALPETQIEVRTTRRFFSATNRPFGRVLVALITALCLVGTMGAATASAAAPLPVWSPPSLVDPAFSTESFSCASSTLCIVVGVGSTGAQQYSVYSGAGWSALAATSTLDANIINAVSCAPGTSFCAAVDAVGSALIYSGGSWSSPSPADGTAGALTALSCPTSSFCLALTGDLQAVTYDGANWGSPTAGPTGLPALTDLSCASSTLCIATGGTAFSTYNGAGWTTPDGVSGAGLSLVSCAPGTDTCIALDNDSDTFVVSPAGALHTQTINDSDLTSLSCVAGAGAGTVDCVALDEDGGAVSTSAPSVANSWTEPVNDGLLPGADGIVSCISDTTCGAIDDVAFSSAAAGPGATSWTPGPTLGSGGFDAVGCAPDTTDCVAVDATGHVVVSDGSAVSAPTDVDGENLLTAVACPSASVCFAGDENGNLVTIHPGGASGVAPLSSGTAVVAVSCPTASFCAALTAAGTVFTYDGSAWSGPTSIDPATNYPDALSCASASFCVATDFDGNAIGYNGSIWTSASIDDYEAGLDSVSCPTNSFCLAADETGEFITFNGAKWSSPTELDSNTEAPVIAVDCTSATLCQATTLSGIETYLSGTFNPLSTDVADAVACGSSVYCLAVDESGYELNFSGPPSNIGAPTISGTAAQGATLTASPGSWLGTPTTYSYQWAACPTGKPCTAITGATAQTYTVPAVSTVETFELAVTATNLYGTSDDAFSTATGTVNPAPVSVTGPASTTVPSITGTAAVGRTLTAKTGVFSGTAPLTYTYQWYLCAKTCTAIKGATKSTLAVTAADIGKTITVALTAHNSAGSKTAVAKLTGAITAPATTLRAWTAPLLHLSGAAAKLTSIKKAMSYTAPFKAAIAGTVKITWTITEKIAHSKKTRTTTVASVSATTKSPSTKLKIRLTAAGIKLLKSLKSEKVKATVSFTYAYGTSTRTYRATRVLTLSH